VIAKHIPKMRKSVRANNGSSEAVCTSAMITHAKFSGELLQHRYSVSIQCFQECLRQSIRSEVRTNPRSPSVFIVSI
jgi:hypothetical protein